MILIWESLRGYYSHQWTFLQLARMKVLAGCRSFPTELSLGLFYMDTQENLQCVFWLHNYRLETHERGFSIGTRQIFPMRGPFIEIYGESHDDYDYASRNYKTLHDRPIWNIFLIYSWKYINNHQCYFIWKRSSLILPSPHCF